jgi:Tol biopolymer transport system component
MDGQRWDKLEELFHAARQLPSSERDAFVVDRCGGDEELCRTLQSLLNFKGPSPLDAAGHSSWNFEKLCEAVTQSVVLEPGEASLAPGTNLGPYRIEGPLGKGGMGVVYRARDIRLDRPVAVKFLSGVITTDKAALERFRREARAISTLNHPSVCTVYDVGDQDGRPYLVMELMDGQTLKERIAANPFSNDELLAVMIPILEGLEAAHSVGLVHRDVKPANIFLCRHGAIKILDFGLAKSAGTEPGHPDILDTLTKPGTTVGTISYMAPEQARGGNVDARADLFSCGAVLYQMATRTLPFSGNSWVGTLDAVLNQAPRPARELAPDLLPEIERVIDRALQKAPEARYQGAAEMRADLLQTKRLLETNTLSAVRPRQKPAYAVVGSALLVILAAAVWYLGFRDHPVTLPSEYVQLTDFGDSASAPAISPDGRMLAFFRGGTWFQTTSQIYIKPLPAGESTLLTDDPSLKYGLAFTPDSSRVAYTASAIPSHYLNTWTVPVSGGEPALLMRNAAGLTWIGDGKILFSEVMSGTALHMGIVTSDESRAGERRIYFPDHERAMAHYSFISPDRKSILAVEMDSTTAWQRCRLIPMDGSSPTRQVGPDGACIAAAWSPDGKWMYFNVAVNGASHIWRQRFPGGTPEQITQGPGDEQGLAVAPDGKSLISSVGVRKTSVWMHDASGEHPLSSEGSASNPKFSGDFKRVYYLLRKSASGTSELWSTDLASGRSNPSLAGVPMVDFDISPDGQMAAYTSGTGIQAQIFVAPLDRSAPPRHIVSGGNLVSFGAPGELIFQQLTPRANYLARVKTDGTGLTRVMNDAIVGKTGVNSGGTWVGAATNSSMAVSVKDGTRKAICTGACLIAWSRDGAYLYLTTLFDPTKTVGTTLVFPIPPGQVLPTLPPAGLSPNADEKFPGVRIIRQAGVAPGPDPDTYAFAKSEFVGNLFRIPLH